MRLRHDTEMAELPNIEVFKRPSDSEAVLRARRDTVDRVNNFHGVKAVQNGSSSSLALRAEELHPIRSHETIREEVEGIIKQRRRTQKRLAAAISRGRICVYRELLERETGRVEKENEYFQEQLRQFRLLYGRTLKICLERQLAEYKSLQEESSRSPRTVLRNSAQETTDSCKAGTEGSQHPQLCGKTEDLLHIESHTNKESVEQGDRLPILETASNNVSHLGTFIDELLEQGS